MRGLAHVPQNGSWLLTLPSQHAYHLHNAQYLLAVRKWLRILPDSSLLDIRAPPVKGAPGAAGVQALPAPLRGVHSPHDRVCCEGATTASYARWPSWPASRAAAQQPARHP